MGQELTWLEYALASALNTAAWWDAWNFTYGTVARYAARCTDAEWSKFQWARARLGWAVDCAIVGDDILDECPTCERDTRDCGGCLRG